MTHTTKPVKRLLNLMMFGIALTCAAELSATEVAETEQPDEAAQPTQPAPDKATLPTAENINLSEPVVEPTPPAAKTNTTGEESKQQTPAAATPAKPAVKKDAKPAPKDVAEPSPAQPDQTETHEAAPNEASETDTAQEPAEDAAPVEPTQATSESSTTPVDVTPSQQTQEEEPWVFLDTLIMKGSTTRLSWSPDQSFEGIETPTPVLIAHGAKPGPKLCLTAALHGDELNGIEIVRRVLYNIDAKELAGTVIGVPIVNLQGFHRSSRYLTDRRDLNRFFPGNPTGSSASRIAYSFFNRVISHCDLLVDLHTGSFYRTNLPQLRANLRSPEVVALTQNFDAIVVLHSEGARGTLRRAAVDAGIPAVTLEAGGPMELNEEHVEQGVKAINTLLDKNEMLNTISFWGTPQPTFYRSQWVRTNRGGILFSDVKLGGKVRKGDTLGVVTDPITNFRQVILSPVNGRIIGMAVNQVVLPGFAAYHIGITPRTVNQYDEITPPPASEEIIEEDARID
ncbi:succinylglutamate desuccinylase/aspartoacylase family protein [Saccharophagus degradans]|uniref:succinylglutamate desuccinylase/aspartoacylase family protein n=1 Tax=Saccharophagus degradans TaxID=86304 RepID=UPI001C08F20F|nr:succinylglutamate desuccinylase/aspartoacylase family protein [Saccharophagus degradans]MBU2986793.1 succinylglutamate desuccinylase/aspartoacylase family protein [Saccharophagus degradans]